MATLRRVTIQTNFEHYYAREPAALLADEIKMMEIG
jgi:hypothetical protein